MQVYVHEAIIDHSEGIKNSFSASVAQVVQNAVRQGQAETLAKQIEEQMTAMQGQMTALMVAISQNARISAGNGIRLAGQGCLRLLRKTVAGHPERKPTEEVDEALLDVEVPFPVGAFPPRLKFYPLEGLTGAEISGLTHAQIDDLAWFYNVEFGLPSKYDRIICGSHLLGCLFACRTAAACEVCL